MPRTIKVRIVARGTRWQVLVDDMPLGRPVAEPLVELATRLLAGGFKPTTRIILTHTPAGPCPRAAATLGDVVTTLQDSAEPFRAPAWVPLPTNGAHQ